MPHDTRKPIIRNIAEVAWKEFPNHFGGALSKPLVMPQTASSQHIDYRISMYQPMARVALHKHKAREQFYHVPEGEALMQWGGRPPAGPKHDLFSPPPGVKQNI